MSRTATTSSFDLAAKPSGATIHLVREVDSILRLQPVLAELSMRCGQPSAMEDLRYFLFKPGTFRRVPLLLLISNAPGLDVHRLTADDLAGAVLLYRYSVLGKSIGTFSSNDRSGRGTLVAPPGQRSALAEMVANHLLEAGALAVLLSFRDAQEREAFGGPERDRSSDDANAVDAKARWIWREREMPDYLPLERTFDATLAKIGQRTRSNLRYYRRRTERDLGCVFLPEAGIDRAEFLAFNRKCMYAVPEKVAAWRYDGMKDLSEALLMGVRDKDGQWLCLLGGRRFNSATEILWQMNREGLSPYSLSVVMRSYFIEHEIAQGMTRLYIEGGTAHPMRFSFVNNKVMDLAVVRRSWMGSILPKLVKLFIKPDNELALMLLNKGLYGDRSDPNQAQGNGSMEEEER